jgi:hypothetical protein
MTPQEYAMDVVMGTQGDYSGSNAPSIIRRLPQGKIITQFRKFQIIQITMMANLLNQIYKGDTPEQRHTAALQFGYLMGGNMMIGGVLAMPAANIAGMAFSALKGDDPDDLEMQIRQSIGDPDVADLVLKGLPTLIDQDWSAKLGWGNTFSVLPYTDLALTRDSLYEAGWAALTGPTGAAVSNAVSGASQMVQGNIAGGAVEMLPRGLRDAGRATLMATRGLRDRSPYEKQLLEADEIGGYQVFSQAIGAPLASQSRMFAVSRGARNADRFFGERSKSIQSAYVKAFRDRDRRGMTAAQDEWRELQQARVSEGFPRQDISILRNSVQRVREAEAQTRDGIPRSDSNFRYIDRRT